MPHVAQNLALRNTQSRPRALVEGPLLKAELESALVSMDAEFDDKYVLWCGTLEQDFEEMQADMQAAAFQLQLAMEAKVQLQAEVRLLKRRVKQLKGIDLKMNGELSARCKEETMPRAGPSARMPSKKVGSHPLSTTKNGDLLGVLKSSTFKQSSDGLGQTSKTRKRKISWHEDSSVKVHRRK